MPPATATPLEVPIPHAATARGLAPDRLVAYLQDARERTIDEIRELVPARRRHSGRLYELMLDYPLREAKALRPALCIATCRALGGQLAAVLPSAAMLELFHNAFLIHDDVEDDSELRRGAPTLHRAEGVPTAVNVGDGMLALALRPLLDNTRTVGLGKALRILELVARMARESAEGQAIELDWIRANAWDQRDADYFRMVHKKTGWYSFITPVLLGALVGGVEPARLARLGRFATLLGLAFQVQDDALNLDADETAYGKELAGDLWEGKRTLILLHALGAASPGARARAIGILAKRRPGAGVSELEAKSVADVEFLRSLVDRSGAIALARAAARRRAERSREVLALATSDVAPSSHLDFLFGVVRYVIERDR